MKKFMNHLDRLQRFRNNCMKELGPEVARQAEDSQPTQPNTNPIHRTGRLIETKQTSRSSAQGNRYTFSHLTARAPICLLNKLGKDKDTDKDVDAYRVRKG